MQMIKNTRKSRREKEEKINFFEEFIRIEKHFFKDLVNQLKSVKDPRHKSYIEYETDILIFTMLMK